MSSPVHDNAHEAPECIAIVICNEIIEDKRTNNKTLVGLFNQITVPQLPATYARMFIMGSFTDGRGDWDISFRISDPDHIEIMRLDGKGHFEDPLGVIDVVFDIQGLLLTRQGIHFVDVFINGEQKVGRRFIVRKTEGLT